MPENTGLAPNYRYFVTDLLSNEVLAEIPFSGVSYERAIKAAGAFRGKIPVIDGTKSLNLYENTLPGKTALYVVRNEECVWGGIIWSRAYDITTKMLDVSGSEFPSYFYHRRIWKTWSHQYGATVTVKSGTAAVLFDNGSSSALKPGASVHLEFDTVAESRYDGYYKIASSPTPTVDQFNIEGAQSSATIKSVNRNSNTVTVTTEGRHGFHVGDLVQISLGAGSPFNGKHTITNIADTAKAYKFTFSQVGNNVSEAEAVGEATRPLPDGIYTRVTVSVRADTFDYIRSLVGSVFDDFVGIDFPNVYIEPGISYGLDIIERELDNGLAIIKTAEPHNLAVGQAMVVRDLEPVFDGEAVVLETRSDYEFSYQRGGTMAPMPVQIKELEVSKVSASGGAVLAQTTAPHEFRVGQRVTVVTGLNFDSLSGTLNGTFEITETPTATSFKYALEAPVNVPVTNFSASTATSMNSTNLIINPSFEANVTTGWTAINCTVAREAAAYPHSAGNYRLTGTVSALGVFPRIESSDLAVTPGRTFVGSFVKPTDLSAQHPTKIAVAFYTSGNALISTITGDMIMNGGERGFISTTVPATSSYARLLIGVTDNSPVGTKFYVDAVSAQIDPADTDYYDGSTAPSGDFTYSWTGTAQASTSIRKKTSTIVRREIVSNTATLTTDNPHNYSVGQSVVVSGVTPAKKIIEKSLDAALGVATITTDGPHELAAGDVVVVDGLRDVSQLTKREVSGSTVTFTTASSHNFRIGESVSIEDMQDVSTITAKQLTSNVATLTTSVPHNIKVGDVATVAGIYDSYTTSTKVLRDGVATLVLSDPHNFKVNDEIVVSGITDTINIVSKAVENGIAILTTDGNHNFLEEEEITVSGVGEPFDGTFTVLSFTDTRVLYEVGTTGDISPTRGSGSVTGTNSVFNGEFVVSAVSGSSISYQQGGHDTVTVSAAGGRVNGWSALNGTHTVTAIPSSTRFSFVKAGANVPLTDVPYPDSDEVTPPTASVPSVHLGSRVLTKITRNTITFTQGGLTNGAALHAVSGTVSAPSIFNGTHTISSVAEDTFKFPKTATSNVLEAQADTLSSVRAANIYNGTFTITAVDAVNNTFSYSKTHANMTSAPVLGKATATVRPSVVVSSFGPFPGNADIGIEFSTKKYSGTNIAPIPYRGFELTNVGNALDEYSDSLDGFEYRIDCSYDKEQGKFRRTFVLIPINPPNPPAEGELSPITRFGAEKIVFEYPGNIIKLSIEESAENAATRFFAVGENDLGPDAGPPFSVASSDELLRGEDGRRWPILDDDEKVSDVDDEAVLYAYAQRYLSESRPPDAKLNVTVNSSLQPIVGTYAPGDWCSLIVDDEFLKQRLLSDLEPRDTVIIRKIDAMSVSIQDGSTFPETVVLTLVPEWEVDKRG